MGIGHGFKQNFVGTLNDVRSQNNNNPTSLFQTPKLIQVEKVRPRHTGYWLHIKNEWISLSRFSTCFTGVPAWPIV